MSLLEDHKTQLDSAYLKAERAREVAEFAQAKDDYLFHLKLCSNQVQLATGAVDEKLRAATTSLLASSRAESDRSAREAVKAVQSRFTELEAEIGRQGKRSDEATNELRDRVESLSKDLHNTCCDLLKRLDNIDEESRRPTEEIISPTVGRRGIGVDSTSQLAALMEADKKLETKLTTIHERMADAREDRSRLQEFNRSQDIRLADMQTSIFKVLNKVDEYYKTLVEVKERVKTVELQNTSAHTSITDHLCRVDDATEKAVLALENTTQDFTKSLDQLRLEQREIEKGLVMANTRINDDLCGNKELILRMENHYVKAMDDCQLKLGTLERKVDSLEETFEGRMDLLNKQHERDLQDVRLESVGKLAQMIEGIKTLMNEDHVKFLNFKKEVEQKFARLEDSHAQSKSHILSLDGGKLKVSTDYSVDQKINKLQALIEKKIKELEERVRKQAMDDGRRIHEFRKSGTACVYDIRELKREIEQLNGDIKLLQMDVSQGRHMVPPRLSMPPREALVNGTGPRNHIGPRQNGEHPLQNGASFNSPRSRASLSSLDYHNHSIDPAFLPVEPRRPTIGNGSPAMDVCPGPYYNQEDGKFVGYIDKAESDQFSHCEYLRRQIRPDSNGETPS